LTIRIFAELVLDRECLDNHLLKRCIATKNAPTVYFERMQESIEASSSSLITKENDGIHSLI